MTEPGNQDDLDPIKRRGRPRLFRNAAVVGMLGFTAMVAAVVGFSSEFDDMLHDLFGDDLEEMPLYLRTIRFWIFVPVVLLMLRLWSVRGRRDPRRERRVWFVVMFGCLLAILLMVASVAQVWLAYSRMHILRGLAP